MAGDTMAGVTGSGEARPRRWPRVLGLGVGSAVCLAAWASMVYVAILAGGRGRHGDGSGWAVLGLAALGAIVCLFVALAFGQRLFRRPPPASRHRGP